MTAGVDGDFKQRQEDVLQHLLEVGQLLLGVVHVTVDGGRGKTKHGHLLLLKSEYFFYFIFLLVLLNTVYSYQVLIKLPRTELLF